ncbi:unnamed protein product, partial [marine sediment metagenome]
MLIEHTQDFCSHANLAGQVHDKTVKLTDIEKIEAYDKFGESSSQLTTDLHDSFKPIGAVTMIWSPNSQISESPRGLGVYVGGWSDGSKKP